MAELNEQAPGGKHGSGKKRMKKSSTKVDMTPMVDLGFLLLAFFVLTASFSKPQAMEINMPVPAEDQKTATKVKNDRTLHLLLGEKDAIYWYKGENASETFTPQLTKTDFTTSGVRKLLLEQNFSVASQIVSLKKELETGKINKDQFKEASIKAKKNPQRLIVIISADDKAKYQNLVDILDEMQICSIGAYMIVDINPFEVDLLKAQVQSQPATTGTPK
jgi:biopolymer transport protein ExbD